MRDILDLVIIKLAELLAPLRIFWHLLVHELIYFLKLFKPTWEFISAKLIGTLSLIPLGGVKVIVALWFAFLVSIGFLLPRSYIFEGTPDQHWWRDVRYWALIVIALELIPYLYF